MNGEKIDKARIVAARLNWLLHSAGDIHAQGYAAHQQGSQEAQERHLAAEAAGRRRRAGTARHHRNHPARKAQEQVTPPDASITAASPMKARVEPGGFSFGIEPDRTLLQSADAAGIELPSSCRNGTCRTCLYKLVAGRIR